MINKIGIIGVVNKKPSYTHTLGHKSFYRGEITSTRLSGNKDRISFVCDERFATNIEMGDFVFIDGYIRTRNCIDETPRLDVFIFVRELSKTFDHTEDYNEVTFEGSVCFISDVREVGSRKIRVIKVANNANYNKTNYLPCVLWGVDADEPLQVGDIVTLNGRLQSRDYTDCDGNKKTTIELSVIDLRY